MRSQRRLIVVIMMVLAIVLSAMAAYAITPAKAIFLCESTAVLNDSVQHAREAMPAFVAGAGYKVVNSCDPDVKTAMLHQGISWTGKGKLVDDSVLLDDAKVEAIRLEYNAKHPDDPAEAIFGYSQNWNSKAWVVLQGIQIKCVARLLAIDGINHRVGRGEFRYDKGGTDCVNGFRIAGATAGALMATKVITASGISSSVMVPAGYFLIGASIIVGLDQGGRLDCGISRMARDVGGVCVAFLSGKDIDR